MNEDRPLPACLYVVATPLGNLGDITYRAVEILRQVPVIACEDTRHSTRLLSRYGIKARRISYHEHNEQAAAEQIVSLLRFGIPVALITDAGTPGISDPGYRVVCLALEQGLKVLPLPGPSALTTALSAAGLPTDSFFFAGFPPVRRSALDKFLAGLSGLNATLVFFCPARRIRTFLARCRDLLGDRRAAVCRELTKLHEEFLRGRLSGLEESLGQRAAIRGEIVLVVEGCTRSGPAGREPDPQERLKELLDGIEDSRSLGAKRLTFLAARQLGLPRNRVYPLVCAYLNRLKND